MFTEYYKYPLDVPGIFESRHLQKCSRGEVISQNLQLIIRNCYGEHRHNKTLCCALRELDFDSIMNIRMWEEKLRRSLLQSIQQNEPALKQTEVDVKFSETECEEMTHVYTSIRRQVSITIHAVLNHTGNKYYFQTHFFFKSCIL